MPLYLPVIVGRDSFEGQAPRVPDYDRDEILDYLREKYDLETDEDIRSEFGVGASQLINLASELEPGHEDAERQLDILDLFAEIDRRYESSHWVNEADARFKDDAEGKVLYNGLLYDPENNEAYIMVTETEWVEDLDNDEK